MYSPHPVFLYLNGLNNSFMQLTTLYVPGYSWPDSPPKINLVDRASFILIVWYGSLTYFWGLLKSFAAKILSPLMEEFFFQIVGLKYYSFKEFKCCVSSVVVTLRVIFGSESWLTDTPCSMLEIA